MAVPVGARWEVTAFLGLTAATGLIDAVSYLKLGHTFVANMTGNIVFLGFAVSPESGFSFGPPIAAVLGFVLGSLAGGRAARAMESRPRRWLASAFGAQAVVLWLCALLVGLGVLEESGGTSYVLIVALAACFGLQNATVRHVAPRDMTTTVLTLTLTGLAADSVLGNGRSVKPHRRLGSIAAMLVGAAVGALLLRWTVGWVIALAGLMVAGAAVIFLRAPEASPAADRV
ncbi:YoaK family protein [Kribbella sp. NPDC050281]|uniref:YoaK family protein n=1 Tax=Kribbella sp. NPDC050281 TaxID=3155515 RepID=UPI0033C9B70A